MDFGTTNWLRILDPAIILSVRMSISQLKSVYLSELVITV